MIKLTPEQITRRFDIIFDKLTEGMDGFTKMTLITMRPKCEALLCEEDGQKRLFNLIELLGYCLGQKVFFVSEDDIEYIQNIKAMSQE